jgi:hypothetical protein
VAQLDAAHARHALTHEGFDRRRQADPEAQRIEVLARVAVARQPRHQVRQRHPQMRADVDVGGPVALRGQPRLCLRAVAGAAPRRGHQLDQPLVAVLLRQAPRMGVGGVAPGHERERARAVERGGLERRGVGRARRQQQDRDVAERRIVCARDEPGDALVEQARPRFVAGVVELAHRPGRVLAGAQREAGMRVADAEAVEVEPRARHQRDRRIRTFELALDHGREAQQTVLLRRVQRAAAVAQAQRIERRGRGAGRGECKCGRQRGAPHPHRPIGRGASSRCQSSTSARKKGWRVRACANSRP